MAHNIELSRPAESFSCSGVYLSRAALQAGRPRVGFSDLLSCADSRSKCNERAIKRESRGTSRHPASGQERGYHLKYQQLSQQERYTITALLITRHSRAEIARQLGRSRSTITRELGRNRTHHDNKYRAGIGPQLCHCPPPTRTSGMALQPPAVEPGCSQGGKGLEPSTGL